MYYEMQHHVYTKKVYNSSATGNNYVWQFGMVDVPRMGLKSTNKLCVAIGMVDLPPPYGFDPPPPERSRNFRRSGGAKTDVRVCRCMGAAGENFGNYSVFWGKTGRFRGFWRAQRRFGAKLT